MSKLSTVLAKHIKDEKLIADILADMKSTRANNVKYVRTAQSADKVKLAPQAALILGAIDAKTPRSPEEIAALAVKAGLKTKQEPARIFAWYRTQLINEKLIAAAK